MGDCGIPCSVGVAAQNAEHFGVKLCDFFLAQVRVTVIIVDEQVEIIFLPNGAVCLYRYRGLWSHVGGNTYGGEGERGDNRNDKSE